MISSSPEAFVAWSKEAGFLPAQALWLAQERRLLMSPFLAGKSASADPLLAQALEVRKNLAEAIALVKTPADILPYKEKWVPILAGKPDQPRHQIPIKEKESWCSTIVTNPLVGWVVGVTERAEAIGRLCGAWIHGLSECEKAIADTDPDWEDVLAVVSSRTLALSSKIALENPSRSMDEARHRLAEAVDNAGVQVLSWTGDESPEVMDELRTGIEDSVNRLASRFGVDASLPLLGLGGTVSLFFGVEDDAGGCCWSHKGQAVITLSPQAGFGPLAHEWFHALDGWAGHQEGHAEFASEHEDPETGPLGKAFKNVFKALSNPGKQDDYTHLWEEARQSWQVRMENLVGKSMPDLAGEILEMGKPDWDASSAATRWLVRLEGTRFEGALKGVDRLVTEMRLLRSYHEKITHMPNHAFRAALIESPLEDSRKMGEYLESPCELLAHNFESGFSTEAIFADSPAGHSSLRYPLFGEAGMQILHWQRFFKAIRPVLLENFSPNPKVSLPAFQEGVVQRLAARRGHLKSSPASLTDVSLPAPPPLP